jgi:hypothetical protein
MMNSIVLISMLNKQNKRWCANGVKTGRQKKTVSHARDLLSMRTKEGKEGIGRGKEREKM